ncbi:MAG: GntR family transcriptional regulator [Eubacteriales bacterium]|nr:GntR family transcriptional regulator [Eubacteriales bacterium]
MKKITPVQQQVKDNFLNHFKNSPYNSLLPGERILCEMFHVSRPTLRKVMDILEEEGLITRIHGKGSFYTGNKVSIDYSASGSQGLGLSNVLHNNGGITRSHVLQQEIELPSAEIATRLNIPENEIVFHLKRQRFINDILYNLSDDYIPLQLCPALMHLDFTTRSLFSTLEEHSIIPCKEEKIIEIKKADFQEAAYLKLMENDPISITHIQTYDAQGKVIQYATSKSDAYKSRFHIVSSIDSQA